MADISLADQIDDAIERMIAEPSFAARAVDLDISQLLGIAAELRFLPDPGFRATLKAELLGQERRVPSAARVDARQPSQDPRQDQRREPSGAPLDNILPTLFLPTLFRDGYSSYP